jgi:hypothetical protein
MNKYLLSVSIFLFAHSILASPLTAIMTFESTAISADGVKKQTQFQEIFIRDSNIVWSERIIPRITLHNESEANNKEAHEHEHDLNFATAGKWLVRDATGKIKFRFVRKDEKKIIEPRDSEYGTLGFDGVWETAYYMVNRTELKKMNVLKKPAPEGAIWYEKKDAKLFTRILWDERKELPLSIESGNLDGSANNKITIAPTPAPASLPWTKLANYQTMAYEDLLD